METLKTLNWMIAAVFMICYAYQFFYIPVALLGKRKAADHAVMDRKYAVLICARNEEAVIGDLLDSLKRQSYPTELLDIFVIADNCTDATAETARRMNVHVYERFNRQLIGKGYALNTLLKQIKKDFPEGFDGYFVFDADNILAEDYIEKMHDVFCQGCDIVTGYRNSKNYHSNWISAGYALWFLRESRFINQARSLLKTSCHVSGTGFMFSREIMNSIDDWDFHTLTEDIEFSVDQIVKGRKIAYCHEAQLYDEQPTELSQSWHQRMRWSKGYLQVLGLHGRELIKGMFRGSWSCFDMAMSIMPAFILSTLSVICNIVIALWGISSTGDLLNGLQPVMETAGNAYLLLYVLGLLTTVSEWKRIRASAYEKILYSFTFPIFMFTYVPIAIASLFCRTEWKQIRHTISLASMTSAERKSFR